MVDMSPKEVPPDDPGIAQDVPQDKVTELVKCKASFGKPGVDDNSQHAREAHAIHDAMDAVRRHADHALHFSQLVAGYHKKFCHLMVDNLNRAASDPHGMLTYDEYVVSTGDHVTNYSSKLGEEVGFLEKALGVMGSEVEKLKREDAATRDKIWTRIRRWIPDIIRCLGHVLAGLAAVLSVIHPIGHLVSNIIAILETMLLHGAGMLQEANKATEDRLDDVFQHIKTSVHKEISDMHGLLTVIVVDYHALETMKRMERSGSESVNLRMEPGDARVAADKWKRTGNGLEDLLGTQSGWGCHT